MSDAKSGKGHSLEIQFIVRTRQIAGTRIHANGETEESSDGSTWESLVRLAPSAMSELRKLVSSGEFFDLPAQIEPETPVRDGTSVTWQIKLGDRTHRVVERRGTGANNGTLAAIEEAIERLIGEELNRKADTASPS